MYKITLSLFFSFFILSCSSKTQKLEPIASNFYSDEFFENQTENYYVNQINQIRVKGSPCSKGSLPPLNFNKNLQESAMAHAKDMALHKKVTHSGSGTITDIAKQNGSNSSFIDRILFVGYPANQYDLLGEIVTKTKFKELKNRKSKEKHFKLALKKFINDPHHCQILTNPRFKDVGVGVAKGEDGYYWVINLGETTPY
jgi:uncharacterized protein YkwD